MPYNTGNTVPSNDARDFMDNVQNLDLAINTELLTWPDRRGVQRKTWAGLEAEFFAWLGASSFELPALEYTGTGPLEVLRPTQLIYRTGFPETYYSVKPSEGFPAMLSGSWASDEERLVLRSDGALALGTAALLNAGTGPDDLPKRSQADQLYQPKAATLSSLAGLNGAADRLPYFTGEGAMALAVLSTFARTLLDDADAAEARATLDVYSKVEAEGIAIGVGQTWQDVTSSRAQNTVYTNTTDKPIQLYITGDLNNSTITIGGVPLTGNDYGGGSFICLIVPVGATYSFSPASTAYLKWMELR